MLLEGTNSPEQLPIGAAIHIPRWDLHLRRWVEWHGFVELSGDVQIVRMERRYPSGYFAGEKPGSNSLLQNRRVTKMADVQVTCINKQPRDDPHEGITHLGNPAANWRWTRQQVIDSINSGTNTFFTFVGGKRANIAVVNGPNGQYVRTHADGQWNDNLLALSECR
jgi:hypothetical protein